MLTVVPPETPLIFSVIVFNDSTFAAAAKNVVYFISTATWL